MLDPRSAAIAHAIRRLDRTAPELAECLRSARPCRLARAARDARRDGFTDRHPGTSGFVHRRRLGLAGVTGRLPLPRRFGGHLLLHGRRA